MLKLFAAFFMLLDHFALIFLAPTSTLYLILRLIGRLAMPIFAYKIATGFTYTKHFKQYLLKLLLMTLGTQIPFSILYYQESFFTELIASKGLILFTHWNIGLTFLCSLLVLHIIVPITKKQAACTLTTLLQVLGLCILATLGDYGLYGMGTVIVFYAFIHLKFSLLNCSLLLFGINVLYSFIFWQGTAFDMIITQLPALLSLYFIEYIPDTRFKLMKHFFYYFYPLHIALLLILKALS